MTGNSQYPAEGDESPIPYTSITKHCPDIDLAWLRIQEMGFDSRNKLEKNDQERIVKLPIDMPVPGMQRPSLFPVDQSIRCYSKAVLGQVGMNSFWDSRLVVTV